MSTGSSAARSLVIGLDVGDGRLVEAWARAGELPALAKLVESGSWHWLETTADTLHVSAWPSLYTGVPPGEHGVYYTHQPAPGEQGAVRFREGQYGAPPVWETLARAGKRVFVLDAPYTHACDVPGIDRNLEQVFEWGTWAHYRAPGSTPAALLGELKRAVGEYPLGYEANDIGLAALDPATLTPDLVRGAQARAKAGRWAMERAAWDHMWIVFAETHPAAHYLWPAGATAQELAARDPEDPELANLLAVYRAVDAAIGELVEAWGAGAVFVVSGDGGGPNHAGWHLLPDVLRALGMQRAPGEGEEPDGEAPAPKRGLYAKLRGLVSPEMRQAVSRYLPAGVRDALMKRNEASAVDWSRTRAFTLPTDLEGCLRINLRGREPEGIVAPGAEYDALCEELTAALLELRDARTGERAVQRVVRRDRELPGARGECLPDLIVVWSEERPLEAVCSPAVGTIEAASPDERTGTHRAPGFVVVRGAGLGGEGVMGVAPALLELGGVEREPGVGDRRP